ncbi:MAG: peptidylprolyl isomerase [Kiritimatiellae bacterium]|nr:peptidylprolyl isomerase [Kiritimatiellia bacterium]
MKQAIVNGEPISREAVQFELDRLVKFYLGHGMSQDEIRKNLDKLAEKAQEQAIGAKLLFARAEQLDLPVDEKAIDAQVANVIQQVGGRDNFVKALAQQKISEDDFRKELAKGCRVDALVQQACRGVAEPTEQEVADYYAAHQKDFVTQPQVLAQHILVKTEGMDAADKAQALEKIKEIRARIVANTDPGEVGQAFAREAGEHSDCPSGQQGGSLGWFGPGMMVPEFDKASFAMKCGEVSDVIETQFGYHIILKTDEKAGGPQTLVDVADQVRDLLRHEARGRAMDAFVGELRDKAKIEYK